MMHGGQVRDDGTHKKDTGADTETKGTQHNKEGVNLRMKKKIEANMRQDGREEANRSGNNSEHRHLTIADKGNEREGGEGRGAVGKES